MYLGKLVAARLRQIKIHREVILPGVQRMQVRADGNDSDCLTSTFLCLHSQALWRGIRAREHIQSNVIRPAGAVTIQRMFRGFLARRQKKILLRRKVSARRIQALVRGVQVSANHR